MEVTTKQFKCKFHGEGGQLFLMMLGNAILMFLTLGIYAPWAKVKVLKYFYSNTEFEDHRFRFTATGKELFIGYLKAFAIIIVFYGVFIFTFVQLSKIDISLGYVALGAFYLLIIYFAHFAIYSSLRFRFSRTTYREIRFILTGKAADFAKECFKNTLIMIFTLGIFTPFYIHRQFDFIYNHLHYGNLPFKFEGDEKTFFWMNIKGFFLTLITFGIYMFWFQPKVQSFFASRLSLDQGKFNLEITPGDFFKLVITNLLIIVFTFGFGFAWVIIRTTKFYVERLTMEGALDLDNIVQSIQDKTSATGEGFADVLDVDMGFGI